MDLGLRAAATPQPSSLLLLLLLSSSSALPARSTAAAAGGRERGSERCPQPAPAGPRRRAATTGAAGRSPRCSQPFWGKMH